jgi:hypothetical protein
LRPRLLGYAKVGCRFGAAHHVIACQLHAAATARSVKVPKVI